MDEKQIAEIEEEIKDIEIVNPKSIVRHIPALIAEVRRLRKVLEEYADRNNWQRSNYARGDEEEYYNDLWRPTEHGYTRAEDALKEGE